MFFYHSVMCLDIIQAHDAYFFWEKISFESLNAEGVSPVFFLNAVLK